MLLLLLIFYIHFFFRLSYFLLVEMLLFSYIIYNGFFPFLFLHMEIENTDIHTKKKHIDDELSMVFLKASIKITTILTTKRNELKEGKKTTTPAKNAKYFHYPHIFEIATSHFVCK